MKIRNSSQPSRGRPAAAGTTPGSPSAAGPGPGRLTAWACAVAALHLLLLSAPAIEPWRAGQRHPMPLRVAVIGLPAPPGMPQLASALSVPPPVANLARPPARLADQATGPARSPAPSPSASPGPSSEGAARESASPATQRVIPRLPPSRTLAFSVHGLSRGILLEGDAVLAWRQDGRRYEAALRQETGAGRREMHSVGELTALGLAPSRFGDRVKRHAGGDSEQAAHFEASEAKESGPADSEASSAPARRIRFSGNQPDAQLPADAQDRVSVLLQLSAHVAGLARMLQPGDRLTYPVATARAAGRWEFRFEAEELLDLQPPGGTAPRPPLPTLRLHRRPEGPHDLDFVIWLAPALDYLPVRWRLTQDNGDWLEQRWTGADPP